jgi:ferredoxin
MEVDMAFNHGIQAWVDRDLCKGSGPCFTLAPAAFALDENMKAVVLDPSGESEEQLLDAARECPTAAIYLWDDSGQLAP